MVVLADADRWNHNIHYHQLIERALPRGCESVLDVGCGEGVLARQLRRAVPEVVGIDLDERSILLAQQQSSSDEIRFVVGDVLTYPFEPASFGAVTSVATLHHLDARAGLKRMAELLRPGGTLAIIGLARSRLPRDLHRELAATLVHRVLPPAAGLLGALRPDGLATATDIRRDARTHHRVPSRLRLPSSRPVALLHYLDQASRVTTEARAAPLDGNVRWLTTILHLSSVVGRTSKSGTYSRS